MKRELYLYLFILYEKNDWCNFRNQKQIKYLMKTMNESFNVLSRSIAIRVEIFNERLDDCKKKNVRLYYRNIFLRNDEADA